MGILAYYQQENRPYFRKSLERAKSRVADDFFKVLKAAYPRRYQNVNNLDCDWRRHQAIAERKNELLRLLKIHRLAAATPFRRLNVDIGKICIFLPSLAGKTDMELEEIAEFYAIPLWDLPEIRLKTLFPMEMALLSHSV